MRQSHIYYPKQFVGNHNEYIPDRLSITPYDCQRTPENTLVNNANIEMSTHDPRDAPKSYQSHFKRSLIASLKGRLKYSAIISWIRRAAQVATQPHSSSNGLNALKSESALLFSGSLLLDSALKLSTVGVGLRSWQAHAFINKLPIIFGSHTFLTKSNRSQELLVYTDEDLARKRSAKIIRIAINTEIPAQIHAKKWLRHLRRQDLIWDIDPKRVLLLRSFGLNAYWLDPATPGNGWLDSNVQQLHVLSTRYGLAPPTACNCLVLGRGDNAWEHALAEWELSNENFTFHYIPELPSDAITHHHESRLLAAWLLQASALADQLAVMAVNPGKPDPAYCYLSSKPPLCISQPVAPGELRAELQGKTKERSANASTPTASYLFLHENGQQPEAAVVISLFNYASYITTALDSVAAQTISNLELIIVDDASSDDGAAVAHEWMKQNATSKFCRAALLQHERNAGLAAARNSAFRECQAKWIFVLDADNQIFPNAIESCIRHANACNDSSLAVVHTLVELVGSQKRMKQPHALVSYLSWQRQIFVSGNYVDAMALVRHSAWEKVGGYTHIEHGWEDFDFWCKLIEAGFYGVLVPRILARYNAHDNSMTAQTTIPNMSALRRCLKDRHPWLNLPSS
jgi:GT2 family glycosyltransferase